MALIEPQKIIASSLDNFLTFSNPNYTAEPIVIFNVNSIINADVTITIVDADAGSNGFNLVIKGAADNPITANSFNTAVSKTQAVLSLMECLKLNNIFYNITLSSASAITANIDTSRRYKITTSNSTNNIGVGGSYSVYNAGKNNKYVLLLKGNIDSSTTVLSMEKYNNSSTISFNITAPFQYINHLYPYSVSMQAYRVYNNIATAEVINNSEVFILPTTLHKFDEVDYLANYYRDSADPAKKEFLTRNFNRYYNYGEICGLSLLSNVNNATIKKNYYTQSGMFLTSQTGYLYREVTGLRTDFYFDLNLESVEANYNKQVAYVDVVAMSGTTELTNPVRYNIVPKCSENNEIFFVNAIGGIDSFNFLGQEIYTSQIKNQVTYYKNPTQAFSKIKELEYVKQKENQIKFTNTTQMVDTDTAKFLNELAASRFAYKFKLNNPMFTTIIINKLDIETSSKTDFYEIEIEWSFADNSLKV